ncbi:hypothetical protein G7Z17_g5854 [Cylindrodendrum hubeiense]|uniref:Uncharacterized protein n=1 Tax=Cylindrodendrum hubeiense TaxID=595255 RepID=A0A9P5H5W0_9HYPO|nr:hypothetical protein G7Z17_g5854 [Cylindrodendrum hubeiense]
MSDPLPSFKESRLAGNSAKNTNVINRLFWSLGGPLETSIFVLEDAANPEGPREPYFRQTTGGTSWHPISQESLTEPRVSSVSVSILPLSDCEEGWRCNHEHADRDDPNCVYEPFRGRTILARCCGENRPKNLAPLEVQALHTPYVTIHDYVTTLHPVLMGLRQNALSILGMWEGGSLPEETKLVVEVDPLMANKLWIKEEHEWIQDIRTRQEPPKTWRDSVDGPPPAPPYYPPYLPQIN